MSPINKRLTTAQDLFRKPSQLTSKKILEALAKEKDPTNAQALAAAYAQKVSKKVPCNLANGAAALARLASFPLIPHGFIDELAACIDSFTEWKAAKAREIITITDKFRTNNAHNYQRVDTLEGLAESMTAPGVYLLSAPHGCGKTELVGRPFADAALGAVVVSCPLKSLVADVSTRFNAEHYIKARDDFKALIKHSGLDESQAVREFKLSRLAICLPSIVLTLAPYVQAADTLIIDEIAQALIFALSDVIENNDLVKSARLIEGLRLAIGKARRVLVMDADLDDRVIEFIEGCRPNERLNIFELPRTNSGYSVQWLCEDDFKAQAEIAIFAELSAGKRCIIATDSRSFSKNMAELILGGFPSLNVLVVNSHTAGNKKVKDFLRDPNACAHLYDVVIHSPTMKSGVSITRGCFDVGLGVFSGMSIGAPDALQMMRRDRKLTEWSLFVPPLVSTGEPIEPKFAAIGQTQADSIQAAAAGADMTPLEFYDFFKNSMNHKKDSSKREFSNTLFALLSAYHFDIIRNRSKALTDGAKTSELAKEEREAFKIAVLSAPYLNPTEREFLDSKEDKTDDDRAAIVANHIREFAGVEKIDGELFDLFDSGRGVRKVETMERVLDGAPLSLLSIDDGKSLADKRFAYAVASEARALLSLGGLVGPDGTIGGRISQSSQSAMFARIRDKQIMYACLGLLERRFATNKKKVERAQPAIKRALAVLGLEFKSINTRVEGVRTPVRLLEVNADKCALLFSVIDSRARARAVADEIAAAVNEADGVEVGTAHADYDDYIAQEYSPAIDHDEALAIQAAADFTAAAAAASHDEYILMSAIRTSDTRHIDDIAPRLFARGWDVSKLSGMIFDIVQRGLAYFDYDTEVFALPS